MRRMMQAATWSGHAVNKGFGYGKENESHRRRILLTVFPD